MGPRINRVTREHSGTNKSKWNVISISVSPRRCPPRVFPRRVRSFPPSFPALRLPGVIAILAGTRKTFDPAPLNTSDIKSCSIVIDGGAVAGG